MITPEFEHFSCVNIEYTTEFLNWYAILISVFFVEDLQFRGPIKDPLLKGCLRNDLLLILS